MHKTWRILAAALLLVGAAASYRAWDKGKPRRAALAALDHFHVALTASSPEAVLRTVRLPSAVTRKTEAEQAEFVRRALAEEISVDGLRILGRHGEFGPLLSLFPTDGPGWAASAGVAPDQCVAFKLEQADRRTEVVLHLDAQGHRVVRCNNVSQLAAVAKQ